MQKNNTPRASEEKCKQFLPGSQRGVQELILPTGQVGGLTNKGATGQDGKGPAQQRGRDPPPEEQVSKWLLLLPSRAAKISSHLANCASCVFRVANVVLIRAWNLVQSHHMLCKMCSQRREGSPSFAVFRMCCKVWLFARAFDGIREAVWWRNLGCLVLFFI